MPNTNTELLHGLSEDQLAEYNEEGFLKYGPLLNDGEIEELKEIGERLYDNATLDLATGEGTYMLVTPVFTKEPRYGEMLHHHPVLLDIFESILGPDIRLVEDQYFYKPARHGAPLAYHNDNIYYGFEDPTIVTAWIALDEATPENGCLKMLPGSHRSEFEHKPIEGTIIVEAQFEHSELVTVTAKAGELVLFDGLTIHGSGPNTTDKPRRVANLVACVPCEEGVQRKFTDEGNPYLRGGPTDPA